MVEGKQRVLFLCVHNSALTDDELAFVAASLFLHSIAR